MKVLRLHVLRFCGFFLQEKTQPKTNIQRSMYPYCALHLTHLEGFQHLGFFVFPCLRTCQFQFGDSARQTLGNHFSVSAVFFLGPWGLGKRILDVKNSWTNFSNTKTASKRGVEKTHQEDSHQTHQTHQPTNPIYIRKSPEMACLQQVFLWASRTLDPPPQWFASRYQVWR